MTPALDANALTLWRTMPHTHRGYLFIDKPAVVFSAQVWEAFGAYTYPLTNFYYNNPDPQYNYADIEEGMTVCVGTTPGADDLGRTVTKGANESTIFVGYTSKGTRDGELKLVSGAYITVYDDSRVWAKTPRILSDGTIYKWGGLTYTSNTPPPPVIILGRGPGEAGFVDPATNKYTVTLDASGSYPVASGATITGYEWNVKDGTIVSGLFTDPTITVEFPPGRRWVSLWVTDSNGQQSFRRYLIAACTASGANAPITDFTVERSVKRADGQRMAFTIHEPIPANTYPDGATVVYWEKEVFGDTTTPGAYTVGSVDIGTGVDHVKFVGWHYQDTADVAASEHGILSGVTFECYDIARKLDTLPSFPQVVERDAAPSSWLQMADLNIDRYLFYLLKWHSTALELTDFVWSGLGDVYPVPALSSPGATMFQQVNNRAQAIAHLLTCDQYGRLAVKPDPILLDVGDRTDTVIVSLDESDWQALNYTTVRPPRIHWLWGSAVVASAQDADVIGVIQAVKCVAPGDAPGQGASARSQGEQLVTSQSELNAREGHRYAARENAPFSQVVVDLTRGNDAHIDPAYMEWVMLTVSAETAAERGLTWSSARFLPVEVQTTYDHEHGTKRVRLYLEKETQGDPATTVVVNTVTPSIPSYEPPSAYQPPSYTPSPDAPLLLSKDLTKMGLVHSSGTLATTANWNTPGASGGPTWTVTDLTALGLAGTVKQVVLDAFADPLALWLFTTDGIYKLVDPFGTPSVTAQYSLGITWDELSDTLNADASFGIQGFAVAVLHDNDAGIYAIKTTDGSTWSAVQVSASDPLFAGRVPGVWVSSRVPGLARIGATTTFIANGTEDLTTNPGDWQIQAPAGQWISGTGFRTSYCTYTYFQTRGDDPNQHLHIRKVFPTTMTFTQIKIPKVGVMPNQLANTNLHYYIDGNLVYNVDWRSFNEPTWTGSVQGTTIDIYGFIQATGESNYGIIPWININGVSVSNQGEIYESDDYGATWASTGLPLGAHLGSDFDVPWDGNTAAEDIIRFGAESAIKEYNGSSTTIITPTQAPGAWSPDIGRWSLRSSVNNKLNIITAATDGAGNWALFLSRDGGMTWAQVTTPAARTAAYLRAAISGDDEAVLYAWGAANRIATSLDRGNSWDERGGNLPFADGEIVGIFGG